MVVMSVVRWSVILLLSQANCPPYSINNRILMTDGDVFNPDKILLTSIGVSHILFKFHKEIYNSSSTSHLDNFR